MRVLVVLLVVVCSVEGSDVIINTPYPCDTKVVIGIDVSRGLTQNEYDKQIDFIQNKLIGTQWTRYSDLALITYSNTTQKKDFGELESLENVTNFIKDFGQRTENEIRWCPAFDAMQDMDLDKRTHVILFMSHYSLASSCQSDHGFEDKLGLLTFVLLDDFVFVKNHIDTIFPLRSVIEWDIAGKEMPDNWQQDFWRAFGCASEEQFPCDNNILIVYDQTSKTKYGMLQSERDFLIDYVFKEWTHFNNLSLWYYDSEVNSFPFGSFRSLADVKQFIRNSGPADGIYAFSLCDIFKRILKFEENSLHLIIFLTEESDLNCLDSIRALKAKLNSLAFVTLLNKIDYLKSYFNDSRIIEWDFDKDEAPIDWDWQFRQTYSCSNKPIEGYPCKDKKILIGFDISNKLSSDDFKKQMNFGLTKLFTSEWAQFHQLAIFGYPSLYNQFSYDFGTLQNLTDVEQAVQGLEQSDTNIPSLCKAFRHIVDMDSYGAHLILFVTQYTTADDPSCQGHITHSINLLDGITLIILDQTAVNTDLLQKRLPTAKFTVWDIHTELEPKRWGQEVWEGFECDGLSPLIEPNFQAIPKFTKKTAPPTTIITPNTKTIQPISPTTEKKSGRGFNVALLVGLLVPAFIIQIWACLVCFCLYRRRQKMKRNKWKSALQQGYNTRIGDNQHMHKQSDDPWEMLPENVSVHYDEKLGSGAFGDVFSGNIIGDAGIKHVYPDMLLLRNFHDCKVAVKTLPAYTDEAIRNEFQQEIHFMKGLKYHPNLVCMLGYVLNVARPLLLLELCAQGDLLNYMRKNKNRFLNSDESCEDQENAKLKELTSFAWQIANGLEYLSSLDLIHRDVAARNVLLDKDRVCKISDFGLCRLAADNLYTSRGGKLPVRWMALESLILSEYSTKTDVWSYGVLLYEVFTLGNLPYINKDNEDILTFLQDGNRLERPEYCSNEIYELMQTCWQVDPNERPTFTEICAQIKKILESANAENYLDAVEAGIEVEAEVHDQELVSENDLNDYAEIESKSNDSSDELDV